MNFDSEVVFFRKRVLDQKKTPELGQLFVHLSRLARFEREPFFDELCHVYEFGCPALLDLWGTNWNDLPGENCGGVANEYTLKSLVSKYEAFLLRSYVIEKDKNIIMMPFFSSECLMLSLSKPTSIYFGLKNSIQTQNPLRLQGLPLREPTAKLIALSQ